MQFELILLETRFSLMYQLLKSCRVEGVRLFYDVSPFLKKGKTIHRIICVCVCDLLQYFPSAFVPHRGVAAYRIY